MITYIVMRLQLSQALKSFEKIILKESSFNCTVQIKHFFFHVFYLLLPLLNLISVLRHQRQEQLQL